jgi:hypothetical protein
VKGVGLACTAARLIDVACVQLVSRDADSVVGINVIMVMSAEVRPIAARQVNGICGIDTKSVYSYGTSKTL